MTDLLDGLVAVLLTGLLNLLIIGTLSWCVSRSEVGFVSRVYLTTVLLRVVMALALNVSASDSAIAATFWGDSGTYDAAGHLLASRWHGEGVNTTTVQSLSGYGFVYYVGTIYYVFGRNQLLVQLLNATIGSVTVLVVYSIARRLFGLEVARWSALFMAFFPQMLFWSAGMYKDPAVLLCIALSMLAVLRLRDAFTPGMATLLGLTAVCLLSLRFYIFYFVALAALGAFLFGRKGSIVSRLASYGLVLTVLFGAFTLAVKQETLEAQRSYMTLDQIQVTRADQAMWGKSGYGTEYDVSTAGGALRALPSGLIYLLFAPFPWATTNLRQLLVLPETLAWYALMPSFARGLAYCVRHRLRDALPILVFALTLTIAYALLQGNVGTAYRQRTQVTMFYFIFMAVGVVQRARRTPSVEADYPLPSLPGGVRSAGNGREG